jgi:branched-chain amino acid transport system permease protein
MLSQLLVNGLIIGSLYSLLAVSIGLTYRACRFVDLSKAGFVAVAPYFAYFILSHSRTTEWPAILLAVALTVCLASSCHVMIYQRLMRRGATPLVMLLASLGILVAIEGVLSLIFGAEAKSFPQQEIGKGINIGVARITRPGVAILSGNLLVVCCVWVLCAHTQYGLYLRAIASDRSLAQVCGIRTKRVILYGSVASALAAAIAGILQAYDTGLTPTMGFEAVLVGMIAVLLGGSLLWNCAAAVLLGVLQQVSVYVLPTEWQKAIVFVVLLGSLFFRLSVAGGPKEPAA